jgi:hypothetical protein
MLTLSLSFIISKTRGLHMGIHFDAVVIYEKDGYYKIRVIGAKVF